MKGYGAAAKRAVRAARHAWEESLLRRDEPYAAFKWKALEAVALNPDYFMHVLPAHRLVFIEVPKAASSHILAELRRAAGFKSNVAGNIHQRSDSGFESPRSIGIRPFVALLDDPRTFIFTAVRNPYSRLVSCYFDKFAEVSIGDGSYISQTYASYGRLAGMPVPDGRPVTFDEFVHFACATAPYRFDGHWCRQSDIVPTSVAPPHLVLRFETLADELPAVLARLDTSCGAPALGGIVRPATTEGRVRDMLSAKTAAQILAAYAGDFARFGYSVNNPG